MSSELEETEVRYVPPAPTGGPAKYLVAVPAKGPERRYPFYSRLDIGRVDPEREATPGLLLIRSFDVSWQHCVVTQDADGRCFVRDVSRNGTRLDGRRLVPNVETEVRLGQTLTIGDGCAFVLAGETATGDQAADVPLTITGKMRRATIAKPSLTVATVLVGDIRDYTVLVRTAPSQELQRCISRLFERLTSAVVEQGGTVKEFQGDAILAFWEGSRDGGHAVAACRAAIALDATARGMARDPALWELQDFPLAMDWALATGPVVIDSFGGSNPMGLSMIGEPVVLAFRIEKLANEQSGSIVVCRETRDRAANVYTFRDLGEVRVKGFDRPDHVFGLVP